MSVAIRETEQMDLPSAIATTSQLIGIKRLKPKQMKAILTLILGKDTSVVLPRVLQINNYCYVAPAV